MKRLNSLLQYVLEESGTWCRTSTDRDWKTILGRIEHEGDSFFTITLPEFGKSLEKAIDRGRVVSSSSSVGDLAQKSDFPGWKRKGKLPVFLGGFLDLVFDRTSGLLLDYSREQVVAIRCIRQICLLYQKVNEPCSDERVRKALSGYIQCEQDVRMNDARFRELPVGGEPFRNIRELGSGRRGPLKKSSSFYQVKFITLLEIFCAIGSYDPYGPNPR